MKCLATKIARVTGGHFEQFLDVFTKLWKATISFVMSVSPSAWNPSAPTGHIFMKFDIWVFLEKPIKVIQISL